MLTSTLSVWQINISLTLILMLKYLLISLYLGKNWWKTYFNDFVFVLLLVICNIFLKCDDFYSYFLNFLIVREVYLRSDCLVLEPLYLRYKKKFLESCVENFIYIYFYPLEVTRIALKKYIRRIYLSWCLLLSNFDSCEIVNIR